MLAAAGRALERYGYVTLEASTADAALQFSSRRKLPIHLLLTNISMPHNGGREIAAAVLADHVDAAVLFMSGDGHADAAEDEPYRWHVLSKPFTPEGLARAVSQRLDSFREAGLP